MDALEKFVEESSIPLVTEFSNDRSLHPFVVKFFNSPSAKVCTSIRNYTVLFTLLCGNNLFVILFMIYGSKLC